jgi:RNA polymerase sigma-70 factor (ECF subfamily)
VVALNRAVAVAEAEGPEGALALVDGLGLAGYHVFHAVRADLLARTGRGAEAAAELAQAARLAPGAGERAYLEARRLRLTGT